MRVLEDTVATPGLTHAESNTKRIPNDAKDGRKMLPSMVLPHRPSYCLPLLNNSSRERKSPAVRLFIQNQKRAENESSQPPRPRNGGTKVNNVLDNSSTSLNVTQPTTYYNSRSLPRRISTTKPRPRSTADLPRQAPHWYKDMYKEIQQSLERESGLTKLLADSVDNKSLSPSAFQSDEAPAGYNVHDDVPRRLIKGRSGSDYHKILSAPNIGEIEDLEFASFDNENAKVKSSGSSSDRGKSDMEKIDMTRNNSLKHNLGPTRLHSLDLETFSTEIQNYIDSILTELPDPVTNESVDGPTMHNDQAEKANRTKVEDERRRLEMKETELKRREMLLQQQKLSASSVISPSSSLASIVSPSSPASSTISSSSASFSIRSSLHFSPSVVSPLSSSPSNASPRSSPSSSSSSSPAPNINHVRREDGGGTQKERENAVKNQNQANKVFLKPNLTLDDHRHGNGSVDEIWKEIDVSLHSLSEEINTLGDRRQKLAPEGTENEDAQICRNRSVVGLGLKPLASKDTLNLLKVTRKNDIEQPEESSEMKELKRREQKLEEEKRKLEAKEKTLLEKEQLLNRRQKENELKLSLISCKKNDETIRRSKVSANVIPLSPVENIESEPSCHFDGTNDLSDLNGGSIISGDLIGQGVPHRVVFNYSGHGEDELELSVGDIVLVLEKFHDNWCVGTSQKNGTFGTFPGNYVVPL